VSNESLCTRSRELHKFRRAGGGDREEEGRGHETIVVVARIFSHRRWGRFRNQGRGRQNTAGYQPFGHSAVRKNSRTSNNGATFLQSQEEKSN